MKRWIPSLVSLLLGVGCDSSDRYIVATITQVPAAAVDLQVRIVIANHTSDPEYFPLPAKVPGAGYKLALRVPKDRIGMLSIETVARDKNRCEVGGVFDVARLTVESPSEIPFELGLGEVPVALCDRVRTPSMGTILAGNYVVGCDASDPSCQSFEGPSRTLPVKVFEIDGTEVTAGAYEDCVTAGVCSAALASESNRALLGARNGVDWTQADTFCKWMGKRLPTEGEWEAAARGGDQRLYPWGDSPPTCNLANFYSDGGLCVPPANIDPLSIAQRDGGRAPAGMYDMAGNVNEWVADWSAPRANLTDEETINGGPPTGTSRIFKGGSFAELPIALRVAHRGAFSPDGSGFDASGAPTSPQQNLPLIGFRCARTP